MKKVILLACAGFLAVGFVSGSVSYAASTIVVSIDQTGKTGDNNSNEPAISGDGRFVAFRSLADNLVPGHAIKQGQIFVRDRKTGSIEIVSKGSGTLGNNSSDQAALSADGRFVAFRSFANNLVPGDDNQRADVFVHDRQTGATQLVSKSSAGTLGNSHSVNPAISANGRFVAFQSDSANLAQVDTNRLLNIFIHDRQTGATEIISVNSKGQPGNGHSTQPAVSADGRFVAFSSDAANLVQGDTNETADVFVRDRKTGVIKIVSKNSKGKSGNGPSYDPVISADGRFVAFHSAAKNLITGDKNDKEDVFVHDRKTGTTRIASRSSSGAPGNGDSSAASISADGRYVAFESKADNLVRGDSNGTADAFVHDMQTGTTNIASVDTAGRLQENGGICFTPVLSDDGRYVAFESEAGNLAQGDTNGTSDIFVHDRK